MVAPVFAVTVATVEQQKILSECMGLDFRERIDVLVFAMVSRQLLTHHPVLEADPICACMEPYILHRNQGAETRYRRLTALGEELHRYCH